METERSKVRGVQKTAESPAHNDKLEATQGNFSAQEVSTVTSLYQSRSDTGSVIHVEGKRQGASADNIGK
jgi:hypothetical protein